MLIAQDLREQTRTDLFQFPERRGAGIQTQGVHDIFGGFRIQILDQQTLHGIAAAGDHIHAVHQGFMELAQHFLHGFPGHGLQFHNGFGDVGYFLPLHALEDVSRKFVAHGEQQHGNTLMAGQLHPLLLKSNYT